MAIDTYDIITSRILEIMDKGTIPWRKPWQGNDIPLSLTTKKAYRGINFFLLSCYGQAAGYKSNYWLTYNQAKKLRGNVRKGEKSVPVIFWNFAEVSNKDSEDGQISGLLFVGYKDCKVYIHIGN